MKKVISLLMVFVALAVINPIPSQAQFQQQSPHLVVAPPPITASATCTTTACPTFTVSAGLCYATVRVTGTNSVLSIVTQVSQDAGANFTNTNVGVVGAGASSPTTPLTTGIIVSNGLYFINVSTQTRVRFLINTLTGTNVTFKPVFTSACQTTAS